MGWSDFLKGVLSIFGDELHSQPQATPRPLPADRLAVINSLDPCPFGLNSHLSPPAYLERFADLGIRWHRVDINWNEIERKQGIYDWAALDSVMQTATRRSLS